MGKPSDFIAVLGGTFDPVHFGHIGMARWLLDHGVCSRLLIVPAGEPPHKSVRTPFLDRFNMARLAFDGLPRTEISDVENRMAAPGYSLDVLRRLKLELGSPRLALVIGADSLRDLGSWHEPEKLLAEFDLIVFPRRGASPTFEELCFRWGATAARRLRESILDAPLFEISSSEIRKKLANGENTATFIPGQVREYIAEHGLYQLKGSK